MVSTSDQPRELLFQGTFLAPALVSHSHLSALVCPHRTLHTETDHRALWQRRGHRAQLVKCLPSMGDVLGFVLYCRKPGMVLNIYDPSSGETEAEGSEVQGQPGYMRPFLSERVRKRRQTDR